ncbi:hypothetical protein LguiA_002560 [Lonicera macranthoides]
MIYTAVDTFYVTKEQPKNSPSRKDGIDEATETNLRIYGCDLIQESGIFLKLLQAVMATGASTARSHLGASIMECRRENLPIEHLDSFAKKYSKLKMDLMATERHLSKEMGFIYHVENPHKFIPNYLAILQTPSELRQEARNLVNDSLRTTLCVRFKSSAVAYGVIYAAARRFNFSLPENPPWWKAFDADKSKIDEVCRVLTHLYSLPMAQYVHVCKERQKER